MSTVQSTRDGLLQAIAANPLDDTPRLMYADYLDEQDNDADAHRAEFIRLGVELERLADMPQSQYEFRVNPWDHEALDIRYQQLLTAHGTEWRRARVCHHCEGHGTLLGCAGDKSNPTCDRCWGTGDVGGLLRRLMYSENDFHGRTEPVRIPEWSRGFPLRIVVTQLDDCLESAAAISDTSYCPTPWFASVLRWHPVTECVSLITLPWASQDEPSEVEYGWWKDTPTNRAVDPDDTDGLVPSPIFDVMWSEWSASRHEDQRGRWLLWKIRDDAVDAIAEALCTWGRQEKFK